MGLVLAFLQRRLVSPKAICSSPVGLPGVLFKVPFEFFSSAHIHSKLNLLLWREGMKTEGGEKELRSSSWTHKHTAVYLHNLS